MPKILKLTLPKEKIAMMTNQRNAEDSCKFGAGHLVCIDET